MNNLVKKILILLPVVILGLFFFKANYRNEYQHAGSKRLLLFAFAVMILYLSFAVIAFKKQQTNFRQAIIQSSFFVYLFMVLGLTGYFILFREISYHDWWAKMLRRIERRDHVNLQLFEVFRIYKWSDKQVLGNFVMLLPLGIYLPLLSKRMAGFVPVLFFVLFTAALIELLQLATSFRSVDVDDVLLNTSGAILGYLIYRFVVLIWNAKTSPSPVY
jgi:glycopeptide antibiotics resistance protein